MVSTIVATRNPAGVPRPLPNPTEIGVLKSMAEIGAAPVTVRNRTPISPIAFLWRKWTSVRVETSYIDARSDPVRSSAPAGTGGCPGTETSLMPYSFRRGDSCGHEHVLELRVVLERVRAELASHTRLLEPAERRRDAHGRVRVDRDRPGLERPGDPERPRSVLRPDRAGEAVDRVVRDPDRVGLVVEGDDRGDGAEDLLARGAVVVRRLAAKLERDALDRLRGELADPAADRRRARERDLRHVGVLDQAFADDAARACDDVEHALRQARIERDLLELERRERGQLG